MGKRPKCNSTFWEKPQIPAKLVETTQNVTVHFGSNVGKRPKCNSTFREKVRRPVEDAQNVTVHFGSKVKKRPKCNVTFWEPDEQVLAK